MQRNYKGNTKENEIQKKYKGNTREHTEIQREYKRTTQEIQRKFKGNTKDIRR